MRKFGLGFVLATLGAGVSSGALAQASAQPEGDGSAFEAGEVIVTDQTTMLRRHSPHRSGHRGAFSARAMSARSDLMIRSSSTTRATFEERVRWHLEHRILAYSNKTVIFD